MITFEDLQQEFGANLIQLPIERYAPFLRANPGTLSPELALPVSVPILFTAAVSDPAPLFSTVRVTIGDNQTLNLIVLGAAPSDTALLYCLDATGGAVVQADLQRPSFELVNSSMAAFVEFLMRLSTLIRTDRGGSDRAQAARRLREDLIEVDPAAFANRETWWSIAFDRLMSS